LSKGQNPLLYKEEGRVGGKFNYELRIMIFELLFERHIEHN